MRETGRDKERILHIKEAIDRIAHTYEEMKSAIRDRIDMVESGKATFYTNEEVFSSIRGRYGL